MRTKRMLLILVWIVLPLMARSAVSCSKQANSESSKVFTVVCPPGCQSDTSSVWGTDIYTTDSSICKAAIHAGVITNNGGSVTIYKTGRLSGYDGTTKNNITTINYENYYASFSFEVSCSKRADSESSKVFTVVCPPGCQSETSSVRGTDIYTTDSSICKAAIHAGVITNNGGPVTIHKIDGLSKYDGSTKNNITSKDWGSYNISFSFGVTCSKQADSESSNVFTVACPSGCQRDNAEVWGTDIYTTDSSICKAAIHAGVITNNGGSVTIKKIDGLRKYEGSTKNNITTTGYGKYSSSFSVEAATTTKLSTQATSTTSTSSILIGTRKQTTTFIQIIDIEVSTTGFKPLTKSSQSNAQTAIFYPSTFPTSYTTSAHRGPTPVTGQLPFPTGLAVGLVLAGVAILLVIFVVCFITRRRKRQKVSARNTTKPFDAAHHDEREVANNVLYSNYDNNVTTESENVYRFASDNDEGEVVSNPVYESAGIQVERQEVDNILYGETDLEDQKKEVVNQLYEL